MSDTWLADDPARSAVFEAALQGLESPVVVLDPTGRIDWINAAGKRITGYRLEQIQGTFIWEALIPGDETERVQHVFRSLVEGHPPTPFENDWITIDGRRRRFLWSNSVVADATGCVQWVIGTGTDVSTVRSAERELHRSELRAQAMLDAALGGIVAVDPDGIIQFANPALERMFGYQRKELLGQRLRMLVPERLREKHRQHRQRYYEQLPVSRPMGTGLDLRGVRKNGDEFPVEISLGCAGADADNLVVAFVLDLTEARKTETDLARSLAELRNLAGRLLTAQEDERRLIARNLHDGLVQELVAHKVSLNVLARKPEAVQSGLSADLRLVEQSAQQLAEGARAISHDIHPAALEHLGLMPALRAHGAEVQRETAVEVLVQAHGTLPKLPREKALGIFRIVQEAVWNAARHSGAPVVQVSSCGAADVVEITIEDQGCGFEVADGSKGGSLGLVSMKERARLIGAMVKVESTPGRGTRVGVALGLKADG